MGRRPNGGIAMTAAERQRMRRARLRELQPPHLLLASQPAPASGTDDAEVPDSVQIDLPDADKRDAVRISDGNCGTTRSDAPTASTSAELGVGRDEAPQPDLLALDADAIASRILEAVTPEQADRIAKAIDRRLLTWRIGTFDAGLPLGTGGGGRRW
jgi:hypothetical protein